MPRMSWILAPVLAGLVAVALVLWRDENARERPELSPDPVAVTVADHPLAIPKNALRFVGQRRPGPQMRLDLALSWPELAGRTPQTTARFDAEGPIPDVIWVTVTPRGDAIDGAARLATVWVRLFVGDPWDGPTGLQGRRLSPKSGYDGEEIYFEPGVVHPFVARCYPLAPGEPVATCLHDEIVGPLAVQWRFPRGLLPEWPHLAEGLTARLAEWGVAKP